MNLNPDPLNSNLIEFVPDHLCQRQRQRQWQRPDQQLGENFVESLRTKKWQQAVAATQALEAPEWT